ncbi:MAG: serine protein kinase [Pseudomonadota bacterium]|nr:serine protein kinase [Pseudomonadota bacterium]HJO36378.1 serine protein kinase [Gammaproteobacteria bacterium]
MSESSRNHAADLIASLEAYTRQHHATRWRGTLREFLNDVLPRAPYEVARNSHQYIWDMLRWKHRELTGDEDPDAPPTGLFTQELYGVDKALGRVVDYFKAASAGTEVGRRLLLLLGPPSGGKSSMVIMLKRGLEEYSHTDAGALYGLEGDPIHGNPLHLIPHSLRAQFRERYGISIRGEVSPFVRARLEEEYDGDFMQYPVERIFLAEADRMGIGTYAPHDPTTADIADLVGSVDLSKVAEYGDEGDPRAWSWSGAVYAASRGVLEMIEILKVKREFLYLLLTLTQEQNVKVSRFPLIYLDETILAHTNLAEFRKFLQEKENEALLDRMVIVQVPYTLSLHDEAQIYEKLIAHASAFHDVHLDPHALEVAAVFAVMTRLAESEKLDPTQKARLYAGEDVEGIGVQDAERVHQEAPDEGLGGISPRFVINALSNAIVRNRVRSLTSMEVLLALKDAIESDARMDPKQKRQWIDFLVLARKDFYNRWVKQDVHKALFASFEDEAQSLLDKYLDEVEASLDQREVADPVTGEQRKPDERFLRQVEEKIRISDSGKESFRQEVVRKAMVSFKQGEHFTLDNHARLHEAIEQYLFEERRDVLRLVSSTARPDEEARRKISTVQQRLVEEYGYDDYSAEEALNYVTTLLSQE